MMKKLFYVLIGLCAFCSCESTGYRISGYIPGAPDGAKVYLAPYDAFQDPNWDSTVIKNERFVLKNTIPMVSPRVVAITIDLNSGEKDYTIFTTEYSMRTGMEAVYTLLNVDRGVPEVWGSTYDVRDLLNATVKLRDGKKITDMDLPLIPRLALKEALKKIEGTDLEKILKEYNAI